MPCYRYMDVSEGRDGFALCVLGVNQSVCWVMCGVPMLGAFVCSFSSRAGLLHAGPSQVLYA